MKAVVWLLCALVLAGPGCGEDEALIDAGVDAAVSVDAAVDATADAGPDARPCTADCECADIGCCERGVCDTGCTRPLIGLCGPGDCPCTGGTCDERQCCVLSDGGIDDGYGPACMPP